MPRLGDVKSSRGSCALSEYPFPERRTERTGAGFVPQNHQWLSCNPCWYVWYCRAEARVIVSQVAKMTMLRRLSPFDCAIRLRKQSKTAQRVSKAPILTSYEKDANPIPYLLGPWLFRPRNTDEDLICDLLATSAESSSATDTVLEVPCRELALFMPSLGCASRELCHLNALEEGIKYDP